MNDIKFEYKYNSGVRIPALSNLADGSTFVHERGAYYDFYKVVKGKLIKFGSTEQYKTVKIDYSGGDINIDGARYCELDSDGTYNLENINGGKDLQILVLTNITSNVVTAKETGNLTLAGDFAIDQYDTLTLIYIEKRQIWIEISRSNN